MIFKLKSGFSLAELVIVIAIISVLTILSISSAKSRVNTIAPLYYKAYSSLKDAVYNAGKEAGENGEEFPNVRMNIQTGEYFPKGKGKNIVIFGGAKGMCYSLTNYINTTDNNCADALSIATSGDNDTFNKETLQFISTGGMQFYISKPQGILDNYRPIKTDWYIVFVNLDGKRGVNTMMPKGKNSMADIVAFVVTTDAEVVPIGFPTVDMKYLTAVVKYTSDDEKLSEKALSSRMSYYQAKTEAFGFSLQSGKGLTRVIEKVDFESRIKGESKIKFDKTQYLTSGLNKNRGCIATDYACRVITKSSANLK